MRNLPSIAFACSVAAAVAGCRSEPATPAPSLPVVADSGASNSTASEPSAPGEAAAAEVAGPTILGIDTQQQQEMRTLIAEFIKQKQIPGDAAENLNKGFASAMETIRRPANEFGFEPDAEGNFKWPAELEEKLQALRAEYEAKTFFESHEVDLPEWAKPLLDEYNANTISPVRKELLFRLASGDVMMDMT